MNIAAIGVGSNISPKMNVQRAKRLLRQEFKILASSKFIKTKPIGEAKQPDFLNGAILVESHLNREETIRILKAIEKKLGRRPTRDKFSPRTIDLDLVVWNGEVIDPDFFSRPFLQKAIREVLPDINP